jgi:hypothetical protein
MENIKMLTDNYQIRIVQFVTGLYFKLPVTRPAPGLNAPGAA